MHDTGKFFLDICWEGFFQFRLKRDILFLIYLNGQKRITTVVFEVALDVQSVKVSGYPFKQNRSMLKIKTAVIYMFL